MGSSGKKLANVVGGRTARACDNCVRKRARWFCAADDAFLCQSCDSLVHRENLLARSHQRVRLKTAAFNLSSLEKPTPTWDQGFTKKPRTPRAGHRNKNTSHQTPIDDGSNTRFNPLQLVPEIGSEEYKTTTTNSEDQLLYQVPVFDPFAAELCYSTNCTEVEATLDKKQHTADTSFADCDHGSKVKLELNNLNGFALPSDMELTEFEFSADVKNLLGNGVDDEQFDMEGLGFLEFKEVEEMRVKMEEEMQCDEVVEGEIEMMREPFQLCFEFDSPQDEKVEAGDGGGGENRVDACVVKKDDEEECEYDDDHVNINTMNYDSARDTRTKRIQLKLDYEKIFAAWDNQKSPWTTGARPEFNPDDGWPHCLDGCGMMQHEPCDDARIIIGNAYGEREAKVSRYREKRRTRLFSKKIRYEVRKLNAEKRPRMKGRFVKRTNFTPNSSYFSTLNN